MHIFLRGNHSLCSGARNKAFGTPSLRQGPWAKWNWDGTTLTAEVDRYGMCNLFYALIDDGIAISNSITELLGLGAARDFDDAGIAVFLRLGWFIGEDTPFAAIRAFPPGGKLVWTAATGLLSISGAPVHTPLDSSISRGAALDAFVERFRSAVASKLPEDPSSTVLPLSGGRSSRHIALELHRADFHPGMVISQRHFSFRTDEDARVASQVTSELGWPISIEDHVVRPMESEAIKNRIFESCSVEHAWFLPMAKRIREAGISHVYDGVAGDVLSNGQFCHEHWHQAAQEGRLHDLFGFMQESYGAFEVTLQKLLPPDLLKRWSYELAFTRWQIEMDKHMNEEDPASRFMFWNRTRRCIAPLYQRYLPGTYVLMPYMDDAVFDLLTSLPRSYLAGKHFHDDAIALAAPDFAHIPYKRKQPPRDPGAYHAGLLRGMALQPRYWAPGTVLSRGWLRKRLFVGMLSSSSARDSGWYAEWAAWLASLETLTQAPKIKVSAQPHGTPASVLNIRNA